MEIREKIHEIKGILNSIMGYTTLLLDGAYGEINEKQREILNRLLKRENDLLDRINEISEMLKNEG